MELKSADETWIMCADEEGVLFSNHRKWKKYPDATSAMEDLKGYTIFDCMVTGGGLMQLLAKSPVPLAFNQGWQYIVARFTIDEETAKIKIATMEVSDVEMDQIRKHSAFPIWE